MIGQTWPSEMCIFHDAATERTIRQLTSVGNNVHLYFTENSFDSSNHAIIFTSDRASGENRAPHDEPRYNLFRMDLDSGIITQLTDEPHGIASVTKTPDSQIVVYITDRQVRALHTATRVVQTIYHETGPFSLGAPSIANNRRYVAFCRNEQVEVPRGPNYAGFKESFYRIKDGRVTVAYLDGSGWLDAYKDTHWLGHFQFCPDDSTIGSFCHEGPWNLVTQRIWLLDFVARSARPCFRQTEEDTIGHEFWTQDGLLFFDDRGPGHDGTITSDRTQAVAKEVAVNQNSLVPFVGLADRNGTVVRRIDMPFYCNHYHANPDNSILVGDDVDDLVLIDISGERAALRPLVRDHGTSWHTQSSHCHPTWSWDGAQILYASDRGGRVNLYLVAP
ncbi:MAG: oligogalacturonate lyase family protein [Roseiflexaceae bacterium]|nr:oligogalacturonate lyase family protein [Roseiflexaceae bacterium]